MLAVVPINLCLTFILMVLIPWGDGRITSSSRVMRSANSFASALILSWIRAFTSAWWWLWRRASLRQWPRPSSDTSTRPSKMSYPNGMKQEITSLNLTAGMTSGLLSPQGDRVEWSLIVAVVELLIAEQTRTSNMFPIARLAHGDFDSGILILLGTAFSETSLRLRASDRMSKVFCGANPSLCDSRCR